MENQETKMDVMQEEVTNETVQKLTQEEFEKLQTLNQEFMNITMDFGALEVQKLSLENKRKFLENSLMEKQTESDKFTQSLREKYGDININISSGEFVKANTAG